MRERRQAPAQRLSQYWSLLGAYLRPQTGWVVLLALVLSVDLGLELVNPQILRSFIDTAQVSGNTSVLAGYALLFVGVVIATQLIAVLATYLSEAVAWTASNLLRVDLTRRCLQLDLTFHAAHPAGELIERVDGDVALLNNFFSAFLIRVLGRVLLLVGVLVLIGRVDVRAGLALAGYTAVASVVLWRMRRIAVPSVIAWRGAVAALSAFWQEHLAGLEDIRSCGAEGYVLARQDSLMATLTRDGRKGMVLQRLFICIFELLWMVAIALAFAIGTLLLHAGAISIGTVFMIFYYTTMLSDNLLQLTLQLNDQQGATAAIERVRELYFRTSAVQDGSIDALPEGAPTVQCSAVTFAYPRTDPILHNVTFRLEAGRVLGLVGRTGSGKSTLIRLLARFYDPQDGVVLLDGMDIRLARVAAVRRRIGLVTQDVQLFSASLRDNLAFFVTSISDELLITAIQELGLGDWFAALPDGLDTAIAPDRLSAGEAQLLALTRVFLTSPGLVILDEASSRLDPITEARLEHALDRLLVGRTAIIIAHRLATLDRVDEILILEHGAVVEAGPAAALRDNPHSRYAELHRLAARGVLL